MRWTQVSCLNCRLTNSCLHVVVFLSDEIFLSVFFGGKKIKCPRPVAVIRSTLCWAAACRSPALDSSSLFPWRLFSFEFSFSSTCFSPSDFFIFSVIIFFLLVCMNRELQGRLITPSRFLFWIQQVSQFFCMCLRCTNQKFHEIDQKLNVLPVL